MEYRHGLVIVNTGSGKGKSTAAFGTALRAAGNGFSVLVVQFIKGNWKTGERAAFGQFPNAEFRSMGEGFTWDTKDPERDKLVAGQAWAFARERIGSGEKDLVVLDEINYAIDYGYVPLDDVLLALGSRPPQVHVICTGRNAKPELIELADLVTEMREIKHPYKKGIKAQRGIEW
ncbi:MAG TPA: cob(I)yrinic acid a,c-diamide adenosyltransferase [Pirellulales bacterium]